MEGLLHYLSDVCEVRKFLGKFLDRTIFLVDYTRSGTFSCRRCRYEHSRLSSRRWTLNSILTEFPTTSLRIVQTRVPSISLCVSANFDAFNTSEVYKVKKKVTYSSSDLSGGEPTIKTFLFVQPPVCRLFPFVIFVWSRLSIFLLAFPRYTFPKHAQRFSEMFDFLLRSRRAALTRNSFMAPTSNHTNSLTDFYPSEMSIIEGCSWEI